MQIPPEAIQEKLLDLAQKLQGVSGKKQYGYLKKPLKEKVDATVDELEKLPEVAEYYAVWNSLRDNAAAPSNPMGIRADSKHRQKLL